MPGKGRKPTIYLETTIPSYLTAFPSRDLTTAAFQQMTNAFWQTRAKYDLFVSAAVIDEAGAGDTSAARLRLDVLRGIPLLGDDPEVRELTAAYAQLLSLPDRALADALHLAYAVAFELEYLLTWNMRHLANSLTIRRLTEFNRERSLWVPLLVTPQYLLELQEDEP
jgi:hypothetical protein